MSGQLADGTFAPGNKLAQRHKFVHEAIKRAVIQDNGEKLRRMVDAMLDLAATGDVGAASFVRDTLDGKPQAQVELSATGTLQDALKRIALQPVPDVLTSAITIEAEHDEADRG